MAKRGDKELLQDILEAINSAVQYTEDMSLESFARDKKTKDAVIRNLEIIGEAAKNLSINTTEKDTSIEWAKIAGLRDKLIHFYFGINVDLVWDVIKNKLPDLREKIKSLPA